MSDQPKRYVAFDVHKSYVMVAAVNTVQEVVLPPRRISFSRFEKWIVKHLKPTDEVVLEATTNAWYVHDLLEPLVARVVVAHPYRVKLIAAAAVKTDKKDTLALARLLVANLIPEVWVPPLEVRELRALISHRRRLVSQQTAAKNRLNSVLHRHNIVPPPGHLFSRDNQNWWQSLDLPPSEKLRVRQDLATLLHLKPQLAEVETELACLSTVEPWANQMTYLVQLPGIGMLTAMTVLAAIGDIRRFPSAKKLVGYAGLGARVHASGQTHKGGGITKEGRRDLRSVLVEASWSAVRFDPHWQEQFERLARRIGKQKTIVAIARKLLVIIWHVMTAAEADRRANADRVAAKLMAWGSKLAAQRPGRMSVGQFARFHLLKLGLGHDLFYIVRGGIKRLIPSTEKLQTDHPDLFPTDQ
jgi:transposase